MSVVLLKTNYVLAFMGGKLIIRGAGNGSLEGSGLLLSSDDEMGWDDNGSQTRSLDLPKSELSAIRDHLNRYLPSDPDGERR